MINQLRFPDCTSRANLLLPVAMLAVLATGFVLIGQWWFMEGVRGFDQFWYLADTQTLIDGNEPLTNTVFAGLYLDSDESDFQFYFAHNGPLLYLNAWIGQHIGAFNAWKLTNITMHCLTGILVGFSLLKQLRSVNLAVVGYTVYIVMPIGIWQTGNLFQDCLFALLTASLLALATTSDRTTRYHVLAIGVMLFGTLNHPMFAFVTASYILWRSLTPKGYIEAIVTLIGLVALVSLDRQWFPSSFQPNLTAIITSYTPGESNMQWHLRDTPVTITPGLIWAKFLDAFKIQFFGFRYYPFNFPTNLAFLATGMLVWHYRRKYPLWFIYSLIILVLYLAMIVLMQNQPRYQLIVTPVVIMTLFVFVKQLGHMSDQLIVKLIIPVTIGCMVTGFIAFKHIQQTHRIQANTRSVILAKLDHFAFDVRMAFVSRDATDYYLPIITGVAPRPALLVDLNLLTREKVETVIKKFDADVILSSDARIGTELRANYIQTLPGRENFPTQHLFVFE